MTVLYYKTVSYGLSQLRGQLSIIFDSRPVEEFIKDPEFPDSLKSKLALIGEVKKYAIDSLGLTSTPNYSTLYDQQGKPLLMNLTASEKFELKAYSWHFPVLGTVSYKGFFNFEKGRQEADQLRDENYDVDYSPVSAWSTLGWFRDPIFSGMLKRNEGQLAELIIHEMTHATVYLKSSVDFNENLASAVGETGASRFLAFKFGADSQELRKYLEEQDDYNRFARHMLRGTQRLDSLYAAIKNTGVDEKETKKKDLISEIVNSLDTIAFHNSKYKKRYRNELPNNAEFLSYVRYDSQKDEMKRELEINFGGNVSRFLESIKNK